jgi:hypothetical protein
MASGAVWAEDDKKAERLPVRLFLIAPMAPAGVPPAFGCQECVAATSDLYGPDLDRMEVA